MSPLPAVAVPVVVGLFAWAGAADAHRLRRRYDVTVDDALRKAPHIIVGCLLMTAMFVGQVALVLKPSLGWLLPLPVAYAFAAIVETVRGGGIPVSNVFPADLTPNLYALPGAFPSPTRTTVRRGAGEGSFCVGKFGARAVTRGPARRQRCSAPRLPSLPRRDDRNVRVGEGILEVVRPVGGEVCRGRRC